MEKVFIVEESLFFGDSRYPLNFHRQKLAYHLASMEAFERQLSKRVEIERVQATGSPDMLDLLARQLIADGVERVQVVEVHDFELHRRLQQACEKHRLTLETLPTPAFLNTVEENREYRAGRKRWFMADFYQWQRQRFDILMDDEEPEGGQWSFDEQNRRKVPASAIASLPTLPMKQKSRRILNACGEVDDRFDNPRGRFEQWLYPTTHRGARRWLERFCEERFRDFGVYEDAMVHGESFLHHSVLTPMLNVGLITPREVIDTVLEARHEFDVPLNSVEGFIRQIIGWREFMRATYDDLGVTMRNGNHWNHHNPLPDGFYTAQTGIAPLDDCLSRVLDTAYCHHIERLMLIGGFLFLCEVEPDAIYRWFMEMFIDAYDWVMVPNVYAMSQNADGGSITTKPYFSGSNYILKMSNHQRGSWCETWDGLYWRWIWKHRQHLRKNPRWAMMCRSAERMDKGKRQAHLNAAEDWLASM